ncbi:hypothetical protein FB45DRAFT_148850 [Roridomyces roridus]|uniref:F-box domain-containing protein n=1 Tax=Roridomyces roridus TaxID=1738132 RepID=A0AAD7BH08_9AGAR|nr:hypothetical protein FB45DRAFT_148850 [Roridomyces roridus]
MRSSDPVFPPELERCIFEICAHQSPVLITKLMLVAWRVKEWLEPILYRTILLGYTNPCPYGYPVSSFLSGVIHDSRGKSRERFRHSCRNLLVLHCDQWEQILEGCCRLENLYLCGSSQNTGHSSDLSAVVPMLKRLHMDNLPHPLLSSPGSSHTVFPHLTHLEILGVSYPRPLDEIYLSSITSLPQLTHLSFNHQDLEDIFLSILQNCLQLQVLLHFDGKRDRPFADEDSLVKDVRFVVCRVDYLQDWNWVEDWLMGVDSEIDYWCRAERFIAKRRAGEIDASIFTIARDEWYSSA